MPIGLAAVVVVVVDDDDVNELLELIFGFVLPVLVFPGCLVAVDLIVDKWMLFDLWIPDVIRLQFDYCSKVESVGIEVNNLWVSVAAFCHFEYKIREKKKEKTLTVVVGAYHSIQSFGQLVNL